MVLGQDRLICTRPFEWLEIHAGGALFACCPAWLKTPLGHLLSDPLENFWNGRSARAVRTAILNGSFQYCRSSRCPKMAAVRGPVRRVAEVGDPEVRDALTGGITRLPFGPKRIHLCFDDSCNLACPSCRTTASLASGEEEARSALLVERVKEALGPSAEELRLSGTGDPFASPVYRKMLRQFRREDFPKLRRIHLHTNALLWDEAMWARMPHIHPYVRSAEISIDAASAQTYALVRGGDFGKLLDNLHFLSTLPVSARLSFVVQADNWNEMPAFADLGERYGFGVYFSRLVNWGTFTREEFARRAVHHPRHPQNRDFLQILARVARLAHVDIGNLQPLLGRRISSQRPK